MGTVREDYSANGECWDSFPQRRAEQPEYECVDTRVFDSGRYFDVTAEYAKGGPDDALIGISLASRGPEAASLFALPV
jgi:hypothetical protein